VAVVSLVWLSCTVTLGIVCWKRHVAQHTCCGLSLLWCADPHCHGCSMRAVGAAQFDRLAGQSASCDRQPGLAQLSLRFPVATPHQHCIAAELITVCYGRSRSASCAKGNRDTEKISEESPSPNQGLRPPQRAHSSHRVADAHSAKQSMDKMDPFESGLLPLYLPRVAQTYRSQTTMADC
jgi:hypothetical protein